MFSTSAQSVCVCVYVCAQVCVFMMLSEVNAEYLSQLSSTLVFVTSSFTVLVLADFLVSESSLPEIMDIHCVSSFYIGAELENTGSYDSGQAFLPTEHLSNP